MIVTAIYASRERDTLGISNRDVVAVLHHPDARAIDALDDVAQYLRANAQPGDVVIIFSAGDATRVGGELLKS